MDGTHTILLLLPILGQGARSHPGRARSWTAGTSAPPKVGPRKRGQTADPSRWFVLFKGLYPSKLRICVIESSPLERRTQNRFVRSIGG